MSDALCRVLIVDDHTVVRDGLSLILGQVDWVQVAGTADTAEHAVREAVALRPDVVIMDLAIPLHGDDARSGGIVATRRILADAPDVRVLVLSSHGDEASIAAALDAGASGYLVKTSAMGELADAVAAVWHGGRAFGAEIEDTAARILSGDRAPRAFPVLSDQDYAILELIARGFANAEIARTLHLAPNTVGNACTRIYEKLGVTRRTEAGLIAHRAGVGL